MVNAQQWVNKEYPLEERNKITDLNITSKNLEGKLNLMGFFNLKIFNCFDNQLTDLDLSECRELKEFFCCVNSFTNTNFLATLPNPEKLNHLDIGDNNFPKQDLGFLQSFISLGCLRVWNCSQERIDKGIYNRFRGSLKYLQNMENLKVLGIANTDIDAGLEYLAKTKLENLPTKWFEWIEDGVEFGKRKDAKVEKIFEELRPYVIDFKKGKYDFAKWKNNKLMEISREKEELQNQVKKLTEEKAKLQKSLVQQQADHNGQIQALEDQIKKLALVKLTTELAQAQKVLTELVDNTQQQLAKELHFLLNTLLRAQQALINNAPNSFAQEQLKEAKSLLLDSQQLTLEQITNLLSWQSKVTQLELEIEQINNISEALVTQIEMAPPAYQG